MKKLPSRIHLNMEKPAFETVKSKLSDFKFYMAEAERCMRISISAIMYPMKPRVGVERAFREYLHHHMRAEAARHAVELEFSRYSLGLKMTDDYTPEFCAVRDQIDRLGKDLHTWNLDVNGRYFRCITEITRGNIIAVA